MAFSKSPTKCRTLWLEPKIVRTASNLVSVSSTVMSQKGEFQSGGSKKTNHAKFSEKTNISYSLIGTCTHVRGCYIDMS